MSKAQRFDRQGGVSTRATRRQEQREFAKVQASKNSTKWDDLTDLYRNGGSQIIMINNDILNEATLNQFRDVFKGEKLDEFEKDIATLRKDIGTVSISLNEALARHDGRTGKVEHKDLQLFLEVIELYNQWQLSFSDVVQPLVGKILGDFGEANEEIEEQRNQESPTDDVATATTPEKVSASETQDSIGV